MSAQTKYGYSTPIGAAGGIVDVAPHRSTLSSMKRRTAS